MRARKLCSCAGNFAAMPRPLPLGEVASHSDDGEGEPACAVVQPCGSTQSRPLGEGGCERREQTGRVRATHPLSHGLRRAGSPKREPLAKPDTLRLKQETLPPCQGLSLWERWHRTAMTERASPLVLWYSLAAAPKTCPLGEGGCERRERTEGVFCRRAAFP